MVVLIPGQPEEGSSIRTEQPPVTLSFTVAGDEGAFAENKHLAESIKRSASDRLKAIWCRRFKRGLLHGFFTDAAWCFSAFVYKISL